MAGIDRNQWPLSIGIGGRLASEYAAVSPDLVSLGLTRGTIVRIEGMKNEYVVLDRMPAKWKKRIDIYMGIDVKAARAWGKREVNIYWTVPD